MIWLKRPPSSKPPSARPKPLSSARGPACQELATRGEAAELAYDNTDTFNALFSGYHDRYGLKTISEADFHLFPTSNTLIGLDPSPPYGMSFLPENPTAIYTA
jgi:hypothetical protein